MKATPFVILGITCLGVILTAPGLTTGEEVLSGHPAAKSNPWSAHRAQALGGDDWNSGETTLVRNGDGHFYADVVANGVTSHMLVDTGATVVALTGEDAEAMGIQWEAEDVQPIAKGANGDVYGFPVTLDTVQVGQTELHGVEAMVVPKGLGVSLLGQSFLGRLEHVEMNADKMVLGT